MFFTSPLAEEAVETRASGGGPGIGRTSRQTRRDYSIRALNASLPLG